MNEDIKTLNKLEAERKELLVEQKSLQLAYTKAVGDKNLVEQSNLKDKWGELCHNIKSVNRRITLLKNQSPYI